MQVLIEVIDATMLTDFLSLLLHFATIVTPVVIEQRMSCASISHTIYLIISQRRNIGREVVSAPRYVMAEKSDAE